MWDWTATVPIIRRFNAARFRPARPHTDRTARSAAPGLLFRGTARADRSSFLFRCVVKSLILNVC